MPVSVTTMGGLQDRAYSRCYPHQAFDYEMRGNMIIVRDVYQAKCGQIYRFTPPNKCVYESIRTHIAGCRLSSSALVSQTALSPTCSRM